jgi:hypothetical protein
MIFDYQELGQLSGAAMSHWLWLTATEQIKFKPNNTYKKQELYVYKYMNMV